MNIAIVGSNGFIGKHLVDHLSENQDNNLFLFGRNEASLYKTDFKYTQIDLNNSNQILKSFKNIDIVFYLASASIPASSWENPKSEILISKLFLFLDSSKIFSGFKSLCVMFF